MSNIQIALRLVALLSIYALAAALDEQAEQADLRFVARVGAPGCTRADSRRDAQSLTAASASIATVPAC